MNPISTRIACAALFFFILYPPAASLAEGYSFAPEILSTAGELELGMASQSNENRQGASTTRSAVTVFSERVNLAADGYVYHPRFLLFLTRLSGALNEQRTSGDSAVSNLTAGSTDYELRAFLLPQHPYNLELFTEHREAVAPGTFLRGQPARSDHQGAVFNFRERPYSFTTSYTEGSIDSGSNRADTKTLRAQAGYWIPLMSNTAGYTHTESASAFSSSTRELLHFENNTRIAKGALDSRVDNTTTDQTNPRSAGFQTSIFAWREQLLLPLPWNFSSHASYGYRNETDRTVESAAAPAREDFNRSTDASFNLSHQLYQSLTTNYTVNSLEAKSTSGEVKALANALGAMYTKSFSGGRLSAGATFGRGESERVGAPTVLAEAHAAALFGSFLLNQQNVIENTIVVQVKDPLTGSLVTLPAADYLVNHRGAVVELTIESVAPLAPQSDPLFVYEFQVSYALTDESKLITTSHGYSLKLDLLDNLLSPYYSFSTSNQEVVSGSLTGGPDRTTTETAGITTQVGPYSGLIERQSFRSRLNPSQKLRTEAQYHTPLAQNTDFLAHLSYTLTNHPPVSLPQQSPGFREKTTEVNVSLNRNFPRENLNLLTTGSYVVNKSFVESDALSLNAGLTWRVGLFGLNSGAQLSRAESKTPEGNVVLLTQYYYVTVTRRLF